MTATITGQNFVISDESLTVSESVGIYECDFTFDESWNGWQKTAVFQGSGETIEVIIVDGKAQIPWEVLKENGWMRVGVYGTRNAQVKPTIWSGDIYVSLGTPTESTEIEPTPSTYAQILELANSAKETAEDVAEDWASVTAEASTLAAGSPASVSFANNKFTFGIPQGPKGDTGATGATGATPAFSIGTVTTLETGQPASASVTGTAAQPVLNLGLPKGNKGDNGDVANTAPAYSTSATYAVGDYCIYNSQLYRCTTAISTAESWTAAHWTAVQLGGDVSTLRSALSFETFTYNDGWIVTNTEVINPTPESGSGRRYAIIPCSENDTFLITSAGVNSSHRPFCFTDSAYNRLYVLGANAITDFVVVAPKDAAYLIVNGTTITLDVKAGLISQYTFDNTIKGFVNKYGIFPTLFGHGAWKITDGALDYWVRDYQSKTGEISCDCDVVVSVKDGYQLVVIIKGEDDQLIDSGWIRRPYVVKANSPFVINVAHYPTTVSDVAPTADVLSIEKYENNPLELPIFSSDRAKIVAHRGYMGDTATYPENSIPAFNYSCSKLVWGCETDVQETTDGYFVLMHDSTIDRTTTGTGSISSMTYAQTQEVYLLGGDGTLKIPTLADYLEICKAYSVVPLVEVKAVTNYDNLIEQIDALGMLDTCVFIADDLTALAEIKSRAREQLCLLNYLSDYTPSALIELLSYYQNVGIAFPSSITPSAEIAEECHSNNVVAAMYISSSWNAQKDYFARGYDIVVSNSNLNYPDGSFGDYAKKDGTYEDLTSGNAEQLLSDVYTDNSEPYLFRKTGGSDKVGSREYLDKIVGGSLVVNQLCNSASVTVTNGHKYYMKKSGTASIGASTGSAITGLTSGTDMVIDLTAEFGTTIADYVYSLETATAGAGVAWLRQYIDIDRYHPYSEPALKHVENVSAHVMRDADDNIIGNYPLDSSVVLRGVPTLVDGRLKFNGDEYLADGTINRRYGIVDLGTLTWALTGNYGENVFSTTYNALPTSGNYNKMICDKYSVVNSTTPYISMADKTLKKANSSAMIVVNDTSYSDATAFKASLSGTYLVFEKATPTPEQAEPFRQLQICDTYGTESFVTTSEVPVGTETRYPEDLKSKVEGLPWDLSMIAPIEDGTTASKAYTTGQYFLHNNLFCKAIANIASGATFTLNTNYSETTIAAELYTALH